MGRRDREGADFDDFRNRCRGKQRHRSKRLARGVLRVVLRKPGTVDHDLLRVYKCPICRYWHLGRLQRLAYTMNDLDAPVSHRLGHPLRRPHAEPGPPAAWRWSYEGSDPALMLFTAAIARFGMTFPAGARILELGCAESDWLERMAAAGQGFDLVGVDARRERRTATGFTLVQGSGTTPDLFPDAYFDRVVLLGALEHFGLGFYGDPIQADGDVVTLQNVARWLRPGGFVYFDVPVQPTYAVMPNRHFRVYAPDLPGATRDTATGGRWWPPPGTITRRLIRPSGLIEVNRAYSLPEPNCGTWCHVPTEARTPYWFCAVLAEKPA
ncbi:MAG: class I SAM-dependent methyltransferase [Vicinamibacterales bacterium]